MRLKGIVFPSYLNQNAGPRRQKLQWVRHQNKAQRVRNLRNACRPILGSRDPDVVAALARAREAVNGEPEPEFGLLHLVYAASDACDQTGEKWQTCMNYFLDKFDDAKADAAAQAR